MGVWLLLLAVLVLQGLGLDSKLSTEHVFIEGTDTERAHEIEVREFGVEDPLVIMLRGPRGAVVRQGQALEERLDALPRTMVSSPWAPGGAIEGLRPSPDVVALVVNLQRLPGEELTDVLPPVRRQIDETVAKPVRTSVAGPPAIVDSTRRAADEAAAIGERIALPVLLVVLLLVFRSVLAAAIPVIIGGTVVAASRGVLDLLLSVVHFDSIVLLALGMMGLALGVDYSLLIVSRFREEMRDSGDVAKAVHTTVTITGRTVIPAGCGFLLAMFVMSLLLPGLIITSIAIASITASVLSVLSAIFVVPAMLMLLGSNLDRWSLPRREDGEGVASRWSRRLSNRPRLVVWPVVFLLVVGAAQAFALDTGIATGELLPPGDSGRRQQEEIQRALGPGWAAPFTIVMDGRGQPVTTPERLRALAAFQRRVERDPEVETMAGFAAVERGTKQLGSIEQSLAGQERELARLDRGLARAHEGAALNTEGLLKAANGAQGLDSALGAANAGAGSMANALRVASDGSSSLVDGLDRANDGSGRLARGADRASVGAGRLAQGLARARRNTREMVTGVRVLKSAMRNGDRRLAELEVPIHVTEMRLAEAQRALQRMMAGRDDPQYLAALQAISEARTSFTGTDPRTEDQPDPAFEGVGTAVKRAQSQFSVGLYLAARQRKGGRRAQRGVTLLARSSARLERGLRRLAAGSRQMHGGIARLSSGGRTLAPGLQRLSEGAEHLAGGLGKADTGAGRLAGGLGGGAQKSNLLTGALGRIHSGVERQQEGGPSDGSRSDQLQEQSPGLFRSGYFYLASLDGSEPKQRSQAGFIVSLDHGGLAARMLVIPRFDASDSQAEPTRERLQEDASDLARATGTEVVVGGHVADQIDINNAFRDQAPLIRLVLSIVTVLVLVPVVRSLTLPIIAAILNLLTVGATFGLLSLLFNGSLLGGPGYVDATVIPAAIMLIYGLAIDYEVFIFARMREEYVRTGSPAEAIANGLGTTAQVVTGAAVIMIAVFLAFAVSPFVTARAFGVAQAIGVFIDAFLIRLVVIPALMQRLGHWSWWMPAWFDRLLPGESLSAAKLPKEAAS